MQNLNLGDSGEDVRRLQERLREFGFFDGEINGEFDEATKDAVIKFQESEDLAPDGFVGIMTMHELDLLEPEPAAGEGSDEGGK